MKDILITSSVLIVTLLLLRQLFRHTISRRVQYVLWALVLIRLLVPVSLPALEHNVLTVTEPVSQSVERQLEEQMLYALPTEVYPNHVEPGNAPIIDRTHHSNAEHDYYSGGVVIDETQTTHYFFMMPASELLTYIWYIGMAVMTVWLVVSNLVFWRHLCKARNPYSIDNQKHPAYLVEEGLSSPCLFGLFRPAIYLTPACVSSPERLRHVLAHEETHARHLDPLWSLLRSVCLVIYWFDPLVWAAAIVSKTDCELACDEGAMKQLGEDERLAYGQTLLSLIPLRHGAVNPLLSATTMTADKKRLKDRITRIAENRQTVAAALFLALALAATVCALTFTGSKAASSPEPPAQKTAVPTDAELPTTEAGSMDSAIEQAVLDHWDALLPSDYAHTRFAGFAYETHGNEKTAYIFSLRHGFSGSPAISEHGKPVIYASAFLPAAVTFRQEENGEYTLLEYWEPSQETYEADLWGHFPSSVAKTALLEMTDYVEMLLPEELAVPEEERTYFTNGPVFPAYTFTDEVTDQGLCSLVDYYGDQDIYTAPTRTELSERFFRSPVDMLHAIAACGEDVQATVCQVLTRNQSDPRFQEAMASVTQPGLGADATAVYEAIRTSATLFTLAERTDDDEAAMLQAVYDQLQRWREAPGCLSLETLAVSIDETETARIVRRYTGSLLANGNGWSNDYTRRMVAVLAVYEAEYDFEQLETYLDQENGINASYFYLLPNQSTGIWEIVDSSGTQIPERFRQESPTETEGYTYDLTFQQHASYDDAVAYLKRYMTSWTELNRQAARNLHFLHYTKNGSHALYLLTDSGKTTPLRLPHVDSALRYAEPKNTHLNLNEMTYTYEAEVPHQVRSIYTGAIAAEAGLYRYIVDLKDYTCIDIFIPAEDPPTDAASAMEYQDASLALSESTMTHEELLEWVNDPEAAAADIDFLPTAKFEDGEGNLAYYGQWTGTPHVDNELCLCFADGTEASLPLPMQTLNMPEQAYFENNTFVYVYPALGSGFLPAGTYFRFTVDLSSKTISLEII